MVSSLYPDDAYSRSLLPKPRQGPKNYENKLFASRLVCYKCNLRYIFNYILKVN